MRLFTGISLPESTLYSLEIFLGPLRPLARIRWSPMSNLHITTKFIGEWQPDRLAELKVALTQVTWHPFPLSLKGLGWFPNSHSPHVFWMGVEKNDNLSGLAAATDTAFITLGCTKEERPFHPHLTLARTRRESSLAALHQALDRVQHTVLPAFMVNDFHLYQSDSGVYRKLQTVNLTEPRKIY